MEYRYPIWQHQTPDPYEKLLYDAVKGDQTFFNDAKEVELQWRYTDSLLKNPPKPFSYEPGSWGPQ
jgi:glucose-6-phosphate 1-dehydrogenase